MSTSLDSDEGDSGELGLDADSFDDSLALDEGDSADSSLASAEADSAELSLGGELSLEILAAAWRGLADAAVVPIANRPLIKAAEPKIASHERRLMSILPLGP